jgi:hypothetical protein
MKLDRQRLSVASHRLQLPGFYSTCAALVLFVLSGIAMAETAPTVRTDSGWFVDMNRFAASAHAGFKCEDCHGTMLEEGRKHPNPDDPAFLKTPAVHAYDYSRCQKCHQVSYDRYMTGGHALARAAAADGAAVIPTVWPSPVYAAPTCGACHASHYAPSGLSRVESGRRMVDSCGQCHPAHAASYLENIHGRLAVNLNDDASAFCSDCHGAHSVASLKDPEKALASCRRCHAKAGPEYAGIVIHAAAAHLGPVETDKDPAIFWIERVRSIALIVVAVSLVLFFGHSFLWILRELHEKLRKH